MNRILLSITYILLVSGLFFNCNGVLDKASISVETQSVLTPPRTGGDTELSADTKESVTEEESSNECPGPAKAALNFVTMELRPLITRRDLKGPSDTVVICGTSDISGYRRYTRKVDASENLNECETIYIGSIAFLKNFNWFFKDFDYNFPEPMIMDSCKCNQEIYRVRLGEYSDPLIMEKVAGNGVRTPPEDQGEGMIAGIGFDYEIDVGPLNDYPPVTSYYCGAPTVDYIGGDIKKKLETAPKKEYGSDSLTTDSAGCSNFSMPFPALITEEDKEVIKVVVMDTGLDPDFQYRRRGGNHYYHENFFSTGFTSSDYESFYITEGFPFADLDNCHGVFGYDFVNNNAFPIDNHGHGTQLADIILSGNNEGQDNIRVITLKIGDMEESESGKSVLKMKLWEAICAIHYAIDQEVDIINMSWGYRAPKVDVVFESAIRQALNAGIIIVASAGNDNLNVDNCPQWPSSFKGVISVAALDGDANGTPINRLAEFSNYGSSISLAAPGTNISGGVRFTGYGRRKASGTSMAAAIVTREIAKDSYRRFSGILRIFGGYRVSDEKLNQDLRDKAQIQPNIQTEGNRMMLLPHKGDPVLQAIE